MSERNLINRYVANEALAAVSPDLRMRIRPDGRIEFDSNRDGRAELTVSLDEDEIIRTADGGWRGADYGSMHRQDPLYRELHNALSDHVIDAQEFDTVSNLALRFIRNSGYNPDGSRSR